MAMEKQVNPTGTPESQVQPTMFKVPAAEPFRLPQLFLRILVVALTAAAAVLMAAARETKTIQFSVVPTLPAMPVDVLAKSTYSSAFVYFIVANGTVCAYTALSVWVTVRNRCASATKTMVLMLLVCDVMTVALLFSSGGAAAAIGFVGEKGNSHLRWNKVCGHFSRFCTVVAASVVTSHVAAALHSIVVLFSVLNLHRRSL